MRHMAVNKTKEGRKERRKESYKYIFLRTTHTMSDKISCYHYMGYSFWLATMNVLHVPSDREDSTYHGLCYTSCGARAGMRYSSMGTENE